MPADRPNIILILADDMGYSDIGCFGSEIHTPTLDALGHGGSRFSQFYNYARCCPTRAALITGRHPHQSGVGHMTADFGVAPYQGYLNQDCVTIAEALKTAGYNTFMAGKWHVGGDYGEGTDEAGDPTHPTPYTRGFDQHYGILTGGGSYFDPITLVRNDCAVAVSAGEDYYLTDAITDAALEMLEGHGGPSDPFFLYMAYTAPHWPLHARPEDIANCQGRYQVGWDELRKRRHEELKGQGILDEKWDIAPRNELSTAWENSPRQEWEASRMATYAAQIEAMDRNIGRLVSRLEQTGQRDNTLIVFLSDNGGCAEFLREDGHIGICPTQTRDGRPVTYGNHYDAEPGPENFFMSYDLPWANASNTPFRLFKHYVHEGGISTPFVANWPAEIPAGGIVHSPACILDLMPTFVEAAGADYSAAAAGRDIPMEGESLIKPLVGQAWSRQDPIFIEHEANCCVRDGEWKLVRRHPGPWELYNLEQDRTELTNLAESEPARVLKMSAQFDEFARRVGSVNGAEFDRMVVESGWAAGDDAVSASRPGGYAQ